MASKRVLVVDDEERIREVVQVSLEMIAGWDVLEASSAQEGMERAIVERPDAILLDVSMPDMDGLSLFRKLQENDVTRSIPVVLLTAKVQPNDHLQFSQLGLAGVIAKPFDPLMLANQVARVMGWTDLEP